MASPQDFAPSTLLGSTQRRQRPFGIWWRRQSPARQDRFATLGPLLSVLLFLAAIIAAFWYLRNEELSRDKESVKRDAEMAQQQIRLRLIENQEQLIRMAREIVTRTIDGDDFLAQAASFTRERPELTHLTWTNANRTRKASHQSLTFHAGGGTGTASLDASLPVEGSKGEPEWAFSTAQRSAPTGVLAAILRRCRPSGVPGAYPADRPQRLQRHADRRVLDRGVAALLRAGGAVAAACDIDHRCA